MALALAAVASLVAYRFVNSGGPTPLKAAPMATVVAAATPLAVGVQIQPSDLKVVQLPPAALPQHTYTAIKQLVGHVLTVPAVPNEVLVTEMVAAPGTGVGLPPLIPDGMRAVSVKVNDVVSVAGFAIPGTHVDVLLTGNPRQDNDPAKETTVTLLSNVQVLTAGQQLEQSSNGKPEQVTVITLLVDPAGAEKLAMADGFGHIQLALRNPLDHVADKTPPLLNGTLYGAAPKVDAKGRVIPAPPPVWSVQMISGDKQETLHFPVQRAEVVARNS
ncbi:MAG: Flp pilus assembly protein CpaB, partial [Streptosporangiaceae bacterium]